MLSNKIKRLTIDCNLTSTYTGVLLQALMYRDRRSF